MTKTKIALVLGLAAMAALTGCGRKAPPVAPQIEGQPARPPAVTPDPATETARAQPIAPVLSDRSITPAEVSRNPNATKKTFFLDRILN